MTTSVIINGIEYRPVATLPPQSDPMPLCETLRALRKSAVLGLRGHRTQPARQQRGKGRGAGIACGASLLTAGLAGTLRRQR